MNKQIGLGDIAYYLFRPFVYLIDFCWGTDLKDCDKCKERRTLWNSWCTWPVWKWLLLAVFIWLIARK